MAEWRIHWRIHWRTGETRLPGFTIQEIREFLDPTSYVVGGGRRVRLRVLSQYEAGGANQNNKISITKLRACNGSSAHTNVRTLSSIIGLYANWTCPISSGMLSSQRHSPKCSNTCSDVFAVNGDEVAW